MHGALETRLGDLGQSHNRLPDIEQARFSLAYQAQEHLALATTLPAKAVHDL
jgi:hypothetical protein